VGRCRAGEDLLAGDAGGNTSFDFVLGEVRMDAG